MGEVERKKGEGVFDASTETEGGDEPPDFSFHVEIRAHLKRVG